MAFVDHVKSLLGISTYARPVEAALTLGSDSVESIREAYGGQLAPTPYTQTRWLLKDLEYAQHEADSGVLSTCSKIWNSSKRDGVIAGVMSTRTAGIVRLPKKFRGDPEMVSALELGHDSVRSVFDEMCPASELASLADWGIGIGVSVGELMRVPGRSYPVLCTLPPENLVYWWAGNQWWYRSVAGLIQVVPGDGRWVLHVPGGRIAPWQQGLWRAVGRSFILKEQAILHDANWQAKLAHPARVAVAPQGATDEQSQSWFRSVMAWGINTVFGLKPGYDVRLLESNGRGYESFQKTVERSDRDNIIAIAGQEVTTDGGAGFQNSDVHKSIRSDLIKSTADSLAYTINTQILPYWTMVHYGESALERSPCVEWDTTPPKDRNSEATAFVSLANGIKLLTEALAPHGLTPDVREIVDRAGVPVMQISDPNHPLLTESAKLIDNTPDEAIDAP